MSGFAAETVRSMRSLVSSDEQPPGSFYSDSMSLAESLRSFHLEVDASNQNAEALAGLYAELIFGLLDRAFLSLLARYDGDERSDCLDRLWSRVIAELGREWPLEEMASIVHMSIPTLIRQVKKRYDATPMQMLYHLRLKRAVQLLLSSRAAGNRHRAGDRLRQRLLLFDCLPRRIRRHAARLPPPAAGRRTVLLNHRLPPLYFLKNTCS